MQTTQCISGRSDCDISEHTQWTGRTRCPTSYTRDSCI